jgi:glucose-6-phosphate isomerase
MMQEQRDTWHRFQKYYTEFKGLGLAIDISRVDFPESYFKDMTPRLQRALEEMDDLEHGEIANRDEERMVGHYWLRTPSLAPTPTIRRTIEDAIRQVKKFAADVHQGAIKGRRGRFRKCLVIGIGGSALGPQFISDALGSASTDKMAFYFADNTDPDGFDRLLSQIGDDLGRTLCIVVSKSGETKETRNGMVEMQAAYKAAGLDFARHAVAITVGGWKLDQIARDEKWLAILHTWDWVGGRTSLFSPVGLLPAALQGFDVDALLRGASECDYWTRQPSVMRNPAVQLALMWHFLTDGKGKKQMVVLPYKDRLLFFPRYLQQLVMESLGKALNRDGKKVEQGLTVYGNKGSTDQHAYIQQLRDGLSNFFVIFVEVLKDRTGKSIEVEPGFTSGDYLSGFFLGTREALYENGRQSITITLKEFSPASIGALVAMFERAVGLYASLINVNAYHQPGVQAGKKAADRVLKLQSDVVRYLTTNASGKPGAAFTAAEIAKGIGQESRTETVFKICRHLAANSERGVMLLSGDGTQSQFAIETGQQLRRRRRTVS